MNKGIVVIIGAGGMGEAVARRIGSGRKVLVADFKTDLLDGLAGRLGGDGFDVVTHQVDVGSPESIEELATAAAALGPGGVIASKQHEG